MCRKSCPKGKGGIYWPGRIYVSHVTKIHSRPIILEIFWLQAFRKNDSISYRHWCINIGMETFSCRIFQMPVPTSHCHSHPLQPQETMTVDSLPFGMSWSVPSHAAFDNLYHFWRSPHLHLSPCCSNCFCHWLLRVYTAILNDLTYWYCYNSHRQWVWKNQTLQCSFKHSWVCFLWKNSLERPLPPHLHWPLQSENRFMEVSQVLCYKMQYGTW